MQPIQWQDGNLSLYCVPTDAFKMGLLSVSFAFPIDKDLSPIRSLLFAVLKRGCRTIPTQREINLYLDDLYDTDLSVRNEVRGGYQILSLCAEFLNEKYLPQGESLLNPLLSLMASLIRDPLLQDGYLNPAYVEGEKAILCDAIRSEKNSARAWALRHCRELMCQGETCGISLYGSEEQMMAITAEQVTALWKDLVQNAHPIFFCVGPYVPKDLACRIQKAFGLMCRQGQGTIATPLVPHMPASRVDGRETQPITQSVLTLGWRTPLTIFSKDYPALMVFHELFGVCPTCRLFMQVREKYGLCYDCASYLDIYCGTVMAVAGVAQENLPITSQAIVEQLEDICQGHVTSREIAAAKKSLCAGYTQIADDPSAIESFWMGRILYGIQQTPQECIQSFNQVTKEDVIRVAQTLKMGASYIVDGNEEGVV